MAKGTVYYNFGCKDGLVDALLRHGVDLLAGGCAAVTEAEPLEAMEALVDGTLEFFAGVIRGSRRCW